MTLSQQTMVDAVGTTAYSYTLGDQVLKGVKKVSVNENVIFFG